MAGALEFETQPKVLEAPLHGREDLAESEPKSEKEEEGVSTVSEHPKTQGGDVNRGTRWAPCSLEGRRFEEGS
jgi:hypothetical protein